MPAKPAKAEWRLTRLDGEYCLTFDEPRPDGSIARRRYRLGTTEKAKATALASARFAEFRKPLGKTVAELWAAYQREKSGRQVLETMTHTWKALSPTFGALDGDQVNTDHCRTYAEIRRKAGKSEGTIHTELGHLRSILKWALGARLISFAPPIERPSKPAPKDRYITRDEARKMIDAAKVPHVALAIRLMLQTGARAGAALDLTWDRVDFERGQIRLFNPFDQRARKGRATVPMNDSLRAALEEAKRAATTDWVVEWAGRKVASVKRGVKAAAAAAGVTDISPHVFRHTAAVWMAEDGHSMDEIAQMLGHSDSRITFKVYARYSPQHLRRAAASLEI